MDDSRARSTAEAYTILDLHDLVRAGRIRVPQFQRSFRWEGKDVLALFDSLLRGFPVGALLLWKRPAEAARLRIGALDVEAPELTDALWVVDGQQRITSLVSAVDPAGANDRRFALGYSLKDAAVVPLREPEDDLVVPLPDLVDLGRALRWLAEHPEAAEEAERIQQVVERLSKVKLPATIMEQAEERVLREVFDRINNRGKRLNAAEIFDAIHGGGHRGATTAGIAASINAATSFGLLEDKVVVQALLVRRHTDITRDVHGEFSRSRSEVSDFPAESKEEAYIRTEGALLAAVRFLQERCGVPHVTFLPFRFQLLVLTRFFALFREPKERNLELLSRWFWRTSAGADELGISGSQTDLRDMAKRVVWGEESDSVQRLLSAAVLPKGPRVPDLSVFRTTRSDSKVILAAMWNRRPVDLNTGEPMTVEALAEQLVGETTPRAVAADLVPPAQLGQEASVAANKVISAVDGRELPGYLEGDCDLASLLLDRDMLDCLQDNRFDEFISRRREALKDYLSEFLDVRTAHGHEDSAPLSEFIFDDEPELERP